MMMLEVRQVTNVKTIREALNKTCVAKTSREVKPGLKKKLYRLNRSLEFLNSFHRDLSSNSIMVLPSKIFSPLKRLGRM